MAIKPILINSHMVRAILDGRKTVTRRVVKGSENYSEFCGLKTDPDMLAIAKSGEEYPKRIKGLWAIFEQDGLPQFPMAKAPYEPEDVLFVRETWAKCQNSESYVYKADFDGYASDVFLPLMKWRPSIHMPKEAARIWLRVTDVRVERLQEIDDTGAKAEGANWKNGKNVGWEEKMRRSSIERFADIWDSTIKPADRERYGWAANPWVWVIEFERCEKPEQ